MNFIEKCTAFDKENFLQNSVMLVEEVLSNKKMMHGNSDSLTKKENWLERIFAKHNDRRYTQVTVVENHNANRNYVIANNAFRMIGEVKSQRINKKADKETPILTRSDVLSVELSNFNVKTCTNNMSMCVIQLIVCLIV